MANGRKMLQHHVLEIVYGEWSFPNKWNRGKEQRTRRTGPMNSDNIAANSNKIMPDHVLEVDDVEMSLLVQGIDMVIAEGEMI
jgi:hypothetical protein